MLKRVMDGERNLSPKSMEKFDLGNERIVKGKKHEL